MEPFFSRAPSASRAQGETRERVNSAVAALEGLASSLRGEEIATPDAGGSQGEGEDDPARHEE